MRSVVALPPCGDPAARRHVLAAPTLAAALPDAGHASLLAGRCRADDGRIARIPMTNKMLACPSFPLLAWIFGMQPR